VHLCACVGGGGGGPIFEIAEVVVSGWGVGLGKGGAASTACGGGGL
jgi:hypothetical protein